MAHGFLAVAPAPGQQRTLGVGGAQVQVVKGRTCVLPQLSLASCVAAPHSPQLMQGWSCSRLPLHHLGIVVAVGESLPFSGVTYQPGASCHSLPPFPIIWGTMRCTPP